MRMMLRTEVEALAGSDALKSGAMQKAIADFIEKFKPEAVYFSVHEGKRCGVYVFDMKDSNLMPVVAEGFFNLGCKVTLAPCMRPEDLQSGLDDAGL